MLEQCLVANTSDVYNYICPSHGWEAIQDYIYTTIHSLDPEYQDLVGVIGNPDWVEVTGRGSQRRLKIGEFHAVSEGYYTNSKGGTTQQSVVADVLTETGQLWADAITNVSTIGHGSVLQQQDAVHTIKSGYYQPYTVVSCANDVIRGPLDDSAVYFPVPPELQGNLMPNQTDFNTQALGISSFVYPGMTKGQILDIPGSLEQYRLKWIELPQDPFNGSAIGAVILPPPTANTTQEFIVCNLGAGWGSSIINTSSNGGGTAFTTSTIDPSAIAHWNPGFNGSLPYYDSVFQAEVRAADDVDNFFAPSFPEKPVIITDAWANYLSPFVPSLNTTVMDALMSTYQPTGEFQIELEVIIAGWILAGLLTNGLSSIGANGRL